MLRASEITLIITIALTLGLLPVSFGAERKKDKEGSANDQHGKLSWRSSAVESDRVWIYGRYATNKESARKCRIRWECGKQKIQTTLPPAPMQGNPEETELCTISHEDGPKESEGTLYYNGGAVAGEEKKEAAVWYPTKLNVSAAVKSSAILGFEKGEQFYELAISATSKLAEGGKYTYTLSINSTKRAAGKAEGFLLRWTATDSLTIRKALEESKAVAFNSKENYFKLDKTVDGKAQVIAFDFQTKEKLAVQETEVLVLDPGLLAKGKEFVKDGVLARAPLPAHAPSESDIPSK